MTAEMIPRIRLIFSLLLASLLHYGIHTFGAKDGNWIEPGGRRWMVLPGYDEEVWNG